MKNEVVVVLDNVRSMHNVGAILRSCDVFGVTRLLCCGITPYPKIENDTRLPHIAKRATEQIAKASLGAERTIPVNHYESTADAVQSLRKAGYKIVAVEQAANSVSLEELDQNTKVALIFGHEVDGVDPVVINVADTIAEIAQFGEKESLNVAASAAIALHHFATKA